MAPSRTMLSTKHALPFKTNNKLKRKDFHVKQKKARDSLTRDERFRRRREEDRDPKLREERQVRNVPLTIDKKRVWDQVDEDNVDALRLSVDVERLKRRKVEEAEAGDGEEEGEEEEDEAAEAAGAAVGEEEKDDDVD
ncbi:Ribosome production factor 1, partial [Cryomyces antarcticus]